MKSLLISVGLLLSLPANAVDVSVQLHGQVLPGVYGHVQITEPVTRYVTTERYEVVEPVQVVYLQVPHKHRRHWHKHCRHYGACHQRVYFVEPRTVVEYRGHGGKKHRHHVREHRHEHRHYEHD